MASVCTYFPLLQFLRQEPVTLMVWNDDNDLVGAVLGGDERAYRSLMERYEPLIAAYLRGKTRDAQELEDVMQDVFLEAYRGLGQLRDSGRLGPWLLGISRHKLADSYRARARRQETRTHALEDPEAAQVVDSAADSADLAQRRQDREALENALTQLNDKFRVVIELRSMEGKSFPVIARMLAISESAAKMRFKRGLAKLRKSLTKHGLTTGNR